MTAPIEIVVENWTPITRPGSSIRGAAAVILPQVGLRLHTITLHSHGQRFWALFPSKAKFDGDEVVKRDESTGQVIYWSIVTFASCEARREFTDALVAALLEKFPGALDGAE